jgi:predicted RNA binding protein YcfA (HicA-like mRNA interferase family)
VGRTGDDLPRVMNQREAIELLERHGWVKDTGGKHQVKMTKSGHRPITLPEYKRRDYARGFTAAILRQAGLRAPEGADHDE